MEEESHPRKEPQQNVKSKRPITRAIDEFNDACMLERR
jgi:hypothetical protein